MGGKREKEGGKKEEKRRRKEARERRQGKAGNDRSEIKGM